MFLEFCGKLCFSQIRPVFFYSFLLIPFVLSGSYLLSRHSYQLQLEARFADAAKKGKIAIERKMRKEKFIKRYSEADPFFIDKQIESLSFLGKERLGLQSLLQHPGLAKTRHFQERLDFLESERNHLVFTEENIRTTTRIKETEEKGRHSVQMDENDLYRLLATIEDIPLGQYEPISKMPQLFVRDMKMKKIETPLQSEVIEVEMELLKREWVVHE